MINQDEDFQDVLQDFLTNKPIFSLDAIQSFETKGIRLDLISLDKLHYLSKGVIKTLQLNGFFNLKQLAYCSGIQLLNMPQFGFKRVEDIYLNTYSFIQQIADNSNPCIGNNVSIQQPMIKTALIQELLSVESKSYSIPIESLKFVSRSFIEILKKLGISNIKQLAQFDSFKLRNIKYMGEKKLHNLKSQIELSIRDLINSYQIERTMLNEIKLEEQICIDRIINVTKQIKLVFPEKMLKYVYLPSSIKLRIYKEFNKQIESLMDLELFISNDTNWGNYSLTLLNIFGEIIQNLEENILNGSLYNELTNLKSHLTTREVYILMNRFSPNNKATLDDIGKQLTITRERVRQIQTKAQNKLIKILPDLWIPYSQVSIGLLKDNNGDITFDLWFKQIKELGIAIKFEDLVTLVAFALSLQSPRLQLPSDFILNLGQQIPINVVNKAKPIIHNACNVCRNSGAISLQSLYNQGMPEEYTELILCSREFQELSNGWWMRKNQESVAEQVAYKVLFYCGPVTPQQMRNAIKRHLSRLGYPTPPSVILIKLLQEKGIAVLIDGFLKLNKILTKQPNLSSAEKIFISSINEIGPVLTFEFIHEKIISSGFSTPYASNLLRLSPLVYKIKTGLYTQLGVHYSENDIENSKEYTTRVNSNSIIKPCSNGTIEFETTVGSWLTYSGVLTVGQVTGLDGNWPLYCRGEEMGVIVINKYFIRGLSKAVKELRIMTGDRICIEFNTWKRIAIIKEVTHNVKE